MEIEGRRQFGSRYSGRGVFASRIVCADCGGFYGSKVWHSNDPYRTVIWRCNRKYEKGKRCTTPHVKEETIKAGFVQVMAKLLASRQEVLEGCRQILNEVLTTDEQSRQIAKLQDQAVGLAQRIRGLVNENAKTQMTEEEFSPEYDRLVSQYHFHQAAAAADHQQRGQQSGIGIIALAIHIADSENTQRQKNPYPAQPSMEEDILRRHDAGRGITIIPRLPSAPWPP